MLATLLNAFVYPKRRLRSHTRTVAPTAAPHCQQLSGDVRWLDAANMRINAPQRCVVPSTDLAIAVRRGR